MTPEVIKLEWGSLKLERYYYRYYSNHNGYTNDTFLLEDIIRAYPIPYKRSLFEEQLKLVLDDKNT